MTAGRQQSTQLRRTGRIIERPRLMKLLDESDAPVILLVGPAGYGKTTLARQWTRTLNGVIWITCTPAHRDVVTFAEDLVAGIEALGEKTSGFVSAYVRAQNNPQRAARDIAALLATELNEASVQWLVLDDFHELSEFAEADDLIAVLRTNLRARLLIASRVRPVWASTREVLYGEVEEVDSATLALTSDEVSLIIGRRPELDALVAKARGWPALVGLASALVAAAAPTDAKPAVLHRYVADELFRGADCQLQSDLLDLALLPRLDPEHLSRKFGDSSSAVIDRARDLGFMINEEHMELHPLLREFLFTKIAEDEDAVTRVETAVDIALNAAAWDRAFELVLRFGLRTRIDDVVRFAFKSLTRSGHLGTLAVFAEQVRQAPGFPPPLIDLVDAEVALRDGQFQLAADLAYRAIKRLSPEDTLRSRAYALAGQCHTFYADYDQARAAFAESLKTAADDVDETEALHGLVIAKCYGELEDAAEEVPLLKRRRHQSPLHLVRAMSAELTVRRYGEGLAGDFGLDEALHEYRNLQDPRARSALAYQAANVLALKALYREALEPFELFVQDVRTFGLGFAVPYVAWTGALINLGLKRIADADRHIQMIEDAVASPSQRHHVLNARILRARLLLQTGSPERALETVAPVVKEPPLPRAWQGEYLAVRALCLACLGSTDLAVSCAEDAAAMTGDLYARAFALAAQAAATPRTQGGDDTIKRLVDVSQRTEIWDPVLCAARSSDDLVSRMASDAVGQHALVHMANRAGDVALARRAGVRTRATRAPDELLSPRELEVLGLIAQGRRNREIAEALFIAESTVKVHVRHILERLGVRTRAEAVARYERLSVSAGEGRSRN